MVYDFRSSRQPLSTSFCLSISFSLGQHRGAEWKQHAEGWHSKGSEHGSPIIFAGLNQLGVNRGTKLLVACFPLLFVHCVRWVWSLEATVRERPLMARGGNAAFVCQLGG